MSPGTTRTVLPCPMCDGNMRPAGSRKSAYSGDSYNLLQCPACWFSRVEDPPTNFAELYDESYYRGEGADPLTDYESELRDPTTVRLHEWQGVLRVVQNLHPVGAETKWLDVGCGLGGLVRHLRAQGLEGAIGSEDGYARTRAIDRNIPCLTTDELRDRDGDFDVITSIEVIEHVLDPLAFLADIARLLRPGGVFFFTTGNAQPQRDRLTSWPYVIPEIHVSFFEPGTIDRAFEKVGLVPEHHGFVTGFDDIIRYKTIKNLPAPIARAADRLVPWKRVAPLIDRRYGVSAFPVGRKPL